MVWSCLWKVGNKVVKWELQVENKQVKWKVGNKGVKWDLQVENKQVKWNGSSNVWVDWKKFAVAAGSKFVRDFFGLIWQKNLAQTGKKSESESNWDFLGGEVSVVHLGFSRRRDCVLLPGSAEHAVQGDLK